MVRQLVIEMKTNNRRWGARRIVGELRKLGKIISKSTVLNILKESDTHRPDTLLNN